MPIYSLSAPANIPLQIREEAALYVEHLSYTRRYFGPSHVQCMLASPSQCLYAAKSVLNLRHPQMIRRWLLVHGCVQVCASVVVSPSPDVLISLMPCSGKDILVPPTQAAMMQELLLGLGFSDVHLRVSPGLCCRTGCFTGSALTTLIRSRRRTATWVTLTRLSVRLKHAFLIHSVPLLNCRDVL